MIWNQSFLSRRALKPLRCVLIFFALATNSEVDAQPFRDVIDAWVAQDALDPTPENALLFIGDSDVRFWDQGAIDFRSYDVIQRGFGGSEFSDLVRYVDEIVLPYGPAAIVVAAGANDLFRGKSPGRVFEDYQSFVDAVHASPSLGRDPVPIVFVGIAPNRAWWDCCSEAILSLNSMVQQHVLSDPSLHYIDAPSHFLATAPSAGEPPSESLFIFDELHLNQTGYDIWTTELMPVLQSIATSTKTYRPNALHPPIDSRLLFDFGPNRPSERYLSLEPDENGNTWNNWLPADLDASSGRVLAGRHLGSLVTTSGDDTGIGIVITGEFEARLGGGLRDPDPELLGDFAVSSVTQDYFFSDDTYAAGGFMVSGLDVNATYRFRFFGSRSTTRTLATEYLLTGESLYRTELQTSGRDIGSNGAYNGNDDKIATIAGVRPDEFGQIYVDLKPVNGRQAYLGAMEITVTTVPEPTSFAMLAAGLFVIMNGFRRTGRYAAAMQLNP